MKSIFVLIALIFLFSSCTTHVSSRTTPEVKDNLIWLFPPADADWESDCITETAPDVLAQSNFNNKNIIFYIPCQIVDCYFELIGLSEEETQCILNSYKTKYMSIGIDMIFDEEQALAQSGVENWIRVYNRELIYYLKKSKKYKCGM